MVLMQSQFYLFSQPRRDFTNPRSTVTSVANQLIATREPRKLQRVLYQNFWRQWINNQVNRACGLWSTYRILNRKQPFGNCIWFPPHLKRWTGGPATSITKIQSGARRLNTTSTEACQEITSPKSYLVWFCLRDLGPQISYSVWLRILFAAYGERE